MIEDFQSLDFEKIFSSTSADTKPQWGKMTLHHAIEHLADSLKISNGTNPLVTPDVPQQMFDSLKKFLVSKNEFPVGFISPIIGESLPNLRLQTIEAAIEELLQEIKIFKSYFDQDSSAVFYNPTFGLLNKEQWIKFHNKHFNHHLKQFALLPS